MQASGVTTRAALAFYFASYSEAEEEAGPVVAAAWQVARLQCQGGLAVQVHGLYERLPEAYVRVCGECARVSVWYFAVPVSSVVW